jgi:hypothetical protein
MFFSRFTSQSYLKTFFVRTAESTTTFPLWGKILIVATVAVLAVGGGVTAAVLLTAG